MNFYCKKYFAFISIFVFATLFSKDAKAQFNTQLPFIPEIGQSIISRPSIFPENRFYIGLPVLSNVNIGFTNDGIDLFDAKTKTDTGTYLDLTKIIDGLHSQNTIALDYSLDLFSFGFKVKKSYFSLNVTHKAPVIFRYSDNFLNLLYRGNGNFLGQTLDYSKCAISATHYWEIGAGYTRQIDEKWTAGIRIRKLFGLDNLSTQIKDLRATTAASDYGLQLQSDLVINISSPMNNTGGFDSVDKISGYILNTQNSGYALNFGVSYKCNQRWLFSADVNDLGYIRWKSSPVNLKLQNGIYSFSGVSMGQFFNSGNDSVNYIDSLGHSFPTVKTKEAYTTSLPATLMVCAQYQIAKHTFGSLVLRGLFFQNEFIPSEALMIRQKLGKHIALDLNYSRQYGNYNALGSGIDFQLGAFNFFALSDNLIGTLQPIRGKSVHLNFGFSFCWKTKTAKVPAVKPTPAAK